MLAGSLPIFALGLLGLSRSVPGSTLLAVGLSRVPGTLIGSGIAAGLLLLGWKLAGRFPKAGGDGVSPPDGSAGGRPSPIAVPAWVFRVLGVVAFAGLAALFLPDQWAYMKASRSGSPESIEEYLRRFPSGWHRGRVLILKETADFDAARRADSYPAYESYLAGHRDGPHAVMARSSAADLRLEELRASADPKAVKEFLSLYHDDPRRAQTEAHFEGLFYDKAVESQDGAAAERYLSVFPTVWRAPEMEALRQSSLYRQALGAQDLAAMRGLLAKFPDNPWAPRAAQQAGYLC